MKPLYALLSLFLCAAPLTAAVPQDVPGGSPVTPVPQDFAFGCPLPGIDEQGLHTLTIPLAVYERVTRPGLEDLRIFNGMGEAVPFILRPAAEERPPRILRREVPFFPLPAAKQAEGEKLSLQIIQNSEGTSLSINTGAPLRDATGTTGQAFSYLADLSAFDPPPGMLELEWETGKSGLFPLSLAHSRDLSRWAALPGQTVLADLRYDGNTVSQRRIMLPSPIRPYLRLDCHDCTSPLPLKAIYALSNVPDGPERWLQLQGEGPVTERGEKIFTYHLQAKVGVQALQLHFVRPNSMARAVIESRSGEQEAWNIRVQGNFYELALRDLKGGILRNEAMPCARTADAWWRVRVVSDEAGLEKKEYIPRLELGWTADQILFLGRGPGPYTLAFGNAKALPPGPARDSLMLEATQGTESLMRAIEPGPVEVLGGQEPLAPPQPVREIPWKAILLWTVLGIGIAVLALMVRSVWREMRSKKE